MNVLNKVNYKILSVVSESIVDAPGKMDMLELVTKNGYALKHASAELQGDREIVQAAVSQNGCALKYASDEFQGREAGTAGEILAINYLKNEYEKIGVKGGMQNGDYFMPMNVYAGRERRNIDSFNVLAFIKGDEKAY